MVDKNTQLIKTTLKSQIDTIYDDSLIVSEKKDGSSVSDIEIYVSNFVQSLYSKKGWNFFCEENHHELSFPSLVLDPIDGTRDFIVGKPDCCLSLAFFNSPCLDDPSNWGWIYAPFTGFETDSRNCELKPKEHHKGLIVGMVSRTNWVQGLFKGRILDSEMVLIPKGSIALKLAMLAMGACDFVISLTAKNLWDIAGGTILCRKNNINLYTGRVEVRSLEEAKYEGPLVWCREELVDRIFDAIEEGRSVV